MSEVQNTTGPVWVVGEQLDGRILDITYQLVGKARSLADGIGSKVEVLLLGDCAEAQGEVLFAAGADRVYLCQGADLGDYQSEAYSEIVVRQAHQNCPHIILIGSTYMGRELAPLVAARLETGLTAHCIDLVMGEDGVLVQKIPAYGGIISIVCPEKRPQMATVAAGVFPAPEMDYCRTGEIIWLEAPDGLSCRVETIETVRQESDCAAFETAATIVAGGAGACNSQGWERVSELAEVLNAGLGCTRPVVDEGRADLDRMIGQSGKMVTPELYVGVGLSGEQQHMVGIVGAKVMVAINSDSKAPVFEQVDYGIVDRCEDFLPVLIETIHRYRAGGKE